MTDEECIAGIEAATKQYLAEIEKVRREYQETIDAILLRIKQTQLGALRQSITA